MKILIVSWEYPPVVVGGLGRHVHHLAEELAVLGHEVVVLARQPADTDGSTAPTSDRVEAGVRIVAAQNDPLLMDFSTSMMQWTLSFGHAVVRAGLNILHGTGACEEAGPWIPDVIHAHDWLVAQPAITLAQQANRPLVSTIHATEAGRHCGWVAGEVNRQVHSLEWWLAQSSDALITCSQSMKDEVVRLFGPDVIAPVVIHNGIDLTKWDVIQRPENSASHPSILFFGRLEYEKGVQDLLAALPLIQHTHPHTTLRIAGEGTQLEWLESLVIAHDIEDSVVFLGKLGHEDLIAELGKTSAAVLPSRYEPFGIVALEAAATGTPLVVANAGGLGEAVHDGFTGRLFPPGNPQALAQAVMSTLNEPKRAAVMAAAARERLGEEFNWNTVAAWTHGVYVAATESPQLRHQRNLATPQVPERPMPERDL